MQMRNDMLDHERPPLLHMPQLSHFRGSGKSRAEFISAENLGKISHFENYGIFGIILRIFTTI